MSSERTQQNPQTHVGDEPSFGADLERRPQPQLTRTPEHEKIMRSRQTFVTVGAVICAVGALFGTGVLGVPTHEAAGGAFADGTTYIAPQGPAFAVWAPIYLGLLAYTLMQWRPAVADTRRHRVTAGLAAFSMIFQAGWLFAVQLGSVPAALVSVLLLTACCVLMLQRLHRHPAASTLERLVTDGTFGLLLGWLLVAVWFSVFELAYSLGLNTLGFWGMVLTAAALGVTVLMFTVVARRYQDSLPLTAGTVWGLAWIAAARFTGNPESLLIGLVAALAAGAVLTVGLVERRHAVAA